MNDSVSFWFSPEGIQVPAVTTAQMREVDRIAMEETGPNLFQMMENAGRSLALHAMELIGPGWPRVEIVVLAGPGGNGGGGVCAARHLANRDAQVTLCLSEPRKLSSIAEWQLTIYKAAGGTLTDAAALLGGQGARPGIVVDALLGYSLSGQPRGAAAELIAWANTADAPVLSLDVASGIDATTGVAPGTAIQAHRTLTLALPKTGLRVPQTGDLWLADIGIPRSVYDRIGLRYLSPFGAEFSVPLRLP